MFCRKCGKTLLDGDRFCSYCGAQVIERSETTDITGGFEEVVYNNEVNGKKQVAEKPDVARAFSEDESVPKMNITQTWQEITEAKEDKPLVAPWNLDGFPVPGSEPKKTEEIKVDWEKRELLRFENMAIDHANMEKDTDESSDYVDMEKVTEKPLEQEDVKIADKETLKTEAKTDIFELFDRQMKAEEAEINSKNTMVFQREVKEEPLHSAGTTRNSLHTFEEEEIDKFYTFSKKNEEFQKLLDKEYERLKCEPQFNYGEEKKPSNIENLEIKMPEETAVPTVAVEESIHEAVTAESLPVIEEKLIPTREAEKAVSVQKPLIEPEAEPVKAIEPEVSGLPKMENAMEAAAEPIKEPQLEQPVKEPLPWDETESFVGEFTDDEKGKKVSLLAVVLGIIIVALAFEVAVLGIKCFFPESSAAAFINKNLAITTEWINVLKNKGDDKKTETEKQESDKTSGGAVETGVVNVPKIDPLPNKDKASLVAEALPYNINIKNVTSDETLVYDSNKSYRDKNINNSKTIENNIWYEDENGNPTFYDKEVVKTIIQFDSAWIDYVNKKDEAVFSLLKEGSPAFKSFKAFSKLGKITESFDLLKIGEIRQSDTGFYVWVYEEISVTEKSKVQTATYNYVYYMEPVDKQLKIVSYEEV